MSSFLLMENRGCPLPLVMQDGSLIEIQGGEWLEIEQDIQGRFLRVVRRGWSTSSTFSCPVRHGHAKRYEWLSPLLGHFTDTDATCVFDVSSTCHVGGWCFGGLFDNWRVPYAPRIHIAEHDRRFCDAWWLSAVRAPWE